MLCTQIPAEKSSERVCFSNGNLHLQSTHAPKTLSVVRVPRVSTSRVLGVDSSSFLCGPMLFYFGSLLILDSAESVSRLLN